MQLKCGGRIEMNSIESLNDWCEEHWEFRRNMDLHYFFVIVLNCDDKYIIFFEKGCLIFLKVLSFSLKLYLYWRFVFVDCLFLMFVIMEDLLIVFF